MKLVVGRIGALAVLRGASRSSGMPTKVINAKGELVGLIFDGNIKSLPGYFVYDEAVNRAVSVDSRGILEALRAVYKANWIADEIVGAAAIKTAAP
jgi:hypothetical protein